MFLAPFTLTVLASTIRCVYLDGHKMELLKMRGPFVIPRYEGQSTDGARRHFRQTWGYEFPESDDYIRELVRTHHQPSAIKCQDLVLLMHESAGDQAQVTDY